MDIKSKDERRYNMSKIRSKNTLAEICVRKYLFSAGFRYRLHSTDLPGKPDLVFKKYRAAVFINGCFWHLHEGCRYFKWPTTNEEFWKNKLTANKDRDLAQYKRLFELGWRIFIVWECELKPKNRQETLKQLSNELKEGGEFRYEWKMGDYQ